MSAAMAAATNGAGIPFDRRRDPSATQLHPGLVVVGVDSATRSHFPSDEQKWSGEHSSMELQLSLQRAASHV